MKKVYLILLSFALVVVCLPSKAFSQTTTSSNLGVDGVGNWQDTRNRGVTVTSWDNGEPSSGYTVIINSAETIFLDKLVDINGGPVKLIVYGVLEFRQSGKLKLPTGSTIEIMGGGDFVVPVTTNESTLLEIGSSRIKSGAIDALKGPISLNESNLECPDCTPQPVTLLYFKTTASQQSVEISWASSKAWDFSHYELERSADGLAFDFVATIDAAEFSNETVEYSYSDRQPLSGTSYYRLKAVDIDGSFEYKEMAAVKYGAESFKIYPNPSSQGFITVSWSHATEGTSAGIKDNSGRTIRSIQLNGNTDTISTEGLAPGVYFLTVQGPAGRKQAQVLIH